jgi:cell division protein FtsB
VLSLLALAVWVGLIDSHSLWRRVSYARELHALAEENRLLERENTALADRVTDGLSPATVERVAREQYGMRRPGETVYPVVVDEEE